MPVPAQATLFNESVANGVTTSFPYQFMIADADDITAEVDDIIVTTGFAVTGFRSPTGGAVEFAVAPANGSTVLRYLDPVLKRARITSSSAISIPKPLTSTSTASGSRSIVCRPASAVHQAAGRHERRPNTDGERMRREHGDYFDLSKSELLSPVEILQREELASTSMERRCACRIRLIRTGASSAPH